jgi:uncharacterized protein
MPQRIPDEKIVQEIMRRILTVVQPKQVILFGSAMRGEMNADSDLDLLIVVPSGCHRRRTAQEIYRSLVGVGFAADIIVVTDEDVTLYRNKEGMIIKSAMDEGKLLYAA